MQSGRQKRRVAPIDADIQQHDAPPHPPPDEAAPNPWDKYALQSADNAYHNQPLQTVYGAAQQPYFNSYNGYGNTTATRPVGPLGFDWNTLSGGLSQSIDPAIQQAPFFINQALPHSSYDSHGTTANWDSAHPGGTLSYDETLNFDQIGLNSLQDDRQFSALGDTFQSANRGAPPPYSPRGSNRSIQQVSRDNSNNADFPPAQRGSFAAPLMPSPIYQQGNLDCPPAARERLLPPPPPGTHRQPRPPCMEADFSGFKDFSHVKEHIRKAHGIIHPVCGCFLKNRKDIYTDHRSDLCSRLNVDSQAMLHPYAIRSEAVIKKLTEKAPVAPVGRDKIREWSGHQERCWSGLLATMFPGHNFEQPDVITPCKS